MTLQVQPNNGGPQQVINLMNLAGGGQDYTIFDFDGIKKPCDSWWFSFRNSIINSVTQMKWCIWVSYV